MKVRWSDVRRSLYEADDSIEPSPVPMRSVRELAAQGLKGHDDALAVLADLFEEEGNEDAASVLRGKDKNDISLFLHGLLGKRSKFGVHTHRFMTVDEVDKELNDRCWSTLPQAGKDWIHTAYVQANTPGYDFEAKADKDGKIMFSSWLHNNMVLDFFEECGIDPFNDEDTVENVVDDAWNEFFGDY